MNKMNKWTKNLLKRCPITINETHFNGWTNNFTQLKHYEYDSSNVQVSYNVSNK